MDANDLVAQLRRRYAGAPARRRRIRERSSALDAYLIEMQQFTLQRLHSDRPATYTLQKLTEAINSKAQHPFCLTAVRKALIAHRLYALWS
jgi:hypothetical protein